MNIVHQRSDRLDRTYVIRYTLLFLGVFALVFFPFLITHTSLVKKVDGMSQYIVYLRYMGQYLRSALNGFAHGSFTLPSYDFSIGLGDDIGQIVRFHPFDFLSVFVPASHTEILYEVILILRFYAAGLAFSVFAFASARGAAWMNVLSGALVYVFCGFMLIRVVNHPIYAAPFIVFPLLLLGADKVMKRQGLCLFVFSVFLGFWSNYYFMYIMSAGLLFYVLVRFPERFVRDRGKQFLLLFLKMASLYLLGLSMSMMTLYPMIRRYLSSARLPQSAGAAQLLVYADKRRYAAWFLNLISPFQSSGNGTNLNYAVIVLPALAALFGLSWKTYGTLKKMLLACLVILLIPGAGYVLAFFNRENSRWVFLLALCLAMAVVLTADCFAALTKRQFRCVLTVSAVFLGMTLLQTCLMGVNVYNMAAAIELAVCLMLLLAPFVRRKGVKAVRLCVLLVTCASTLVNGYLSYSSSFGALTKEYVKAGKTIPLYQKFYRSRGAELIRDDSFYRIEADQVKHGRENSSIFSDYNSTSEYNSILNADWMDAMISQNNLGLGAITTISGLDDRPVSLSLAHVKYYIASPSHNGACVPYGFSEEPVFGNRKVSVYECRQLLSFGHSLDAFITRENYDKLDALEREMVQLEAVVAECPDAGAQDVARVLRDAGLKEITQPSIRIAAQDLMLPEKGEGLSYEDGVVHAGRKSSMTFSWEEKAGCDSYLLLKGLDAPDEIANLRLETKGCRTSINVRSSQQLYNTGRKDYLVHLGQSDVDRIQSAKLTFLKKGGYELSSAQILSVPMAHFDQRIAAMNQKPLQEERVEDGRISGTVNFDDPRILVLSVPMAEGWTWVVDGKKGSGTEAAEEGTLLLTADILYQGILLPEGSHTILLTYETPGSAVGRLFAILSILAFLVLVIRETVSRRRRRNA